MRLYYATTSVRAEEVLERGFTAETWFEDQPRRPSEAFVYLDVPDEVAEGCEQAASDDGHRRFLLSAEIPNAYPKQAEREP